MEGFAGGEDCTDDTTKVSELKSCESEERGTWEIMDRALVGPMNTLAVRHDGKLGNGTSSVRDLAALSGSRRNLIFNGNRPELTMRMTARHRRGARSLVFSFDHDAKWKLVKIEFDEMCATDANQGQCLAAGSVR